MKRRDIELHVSDHAVLRYLERRHGIDMGVVRRHLAGLVVHAAELGAVAVRAEDVRIVLREEDIGAGRVHVTVSTVVRRPKMRGLAEIEEVGDDA